MGPGLEADRARGQNKLVQLAVDGSRSSRCPFDQIQCADLSGWMGQDETPAWRKVAASVAALVGDLTPPVTEEDVDRRSLGARARGCRTCATTTSPDVRAALIGREGV